jgi:uncharacterized membrane protein (DUF485 family)
MKKEIKINSPEISKNSEIAKASKKDKYDRNIMEELEGIKQLVVLLSERESNNLNSGNSPIIVEKPFIKPQMKKKRSYLRFLILPSIFIFFAGITYIILMAYFKTDLLTGISASIGVGIVITLLAILINWIFKLNKPKQEDAFEDVIDDTLKEMKNCSECQERLIKSSIMQEGSTLRQYFKCSNPSCDFKKVISFNSK